MTELEIERILKKGEGLTVEYKRAESALPKNLFETVCAFLNRNGGTILLGVEDNGRPNGIAADVVENMCKQFADISNNPSKIEPAFLLHPTVVSYQGKQLIHVFVPASSIVHKANGLVYDRSNEGDFAVRNDNQISEMYFSKRAFFSESTIYPHLNETHFVEGIVEKARTIIRSNGRTTRG